MASFPVVRPVGLLERYHLTRSLVGMDGCLVSIAQYAGPRPLDKRTIYAALKHVIGQVGALGVQYEAAKQPRFVRLSSVDLTKVVDVRTEMQSLEAVISHNLAIPFQVGTDLPLWRIVLLPEGRLMFAYHHAIGDGQSGPAFHRAFLNALNSLPSSFPDSDVTVSVPVDSSLEPPVEERADTSISIATFFKIIFGPLIPASWTAAGSAWTANPVAKDVTLTTEVRTWSMGASEAEALVQLCRQHKTTLTGAMHTVGVQVFSRLLATTGQVDKFKTIETSVPISLRRYTGTSAAAMGDLVSAHYTYAPITRTPPQEGSESSFSWDDAAKFVIALRNGMKSSLQVVGTIKFLFWLGISKKYFLGMPGTKRQLTMEISNLGVFPGEERRESDEWSIGDVYFGQSDPICGAAMKINVVGSPSGTVNTVFTWGSGAIDAAMASGFIEGFKKELLSLVEK